MKKSSSLKLDSFLTDSSIDISIKVLTDRLTAVSIENYEIIIFRSNFMPMLIFICRVFFLTIVDIIRLILRPSHKRIHREHMQKVTECIILFERSYYIFAP